MGRRGWWWALAGVVAAWLLWMTLRSNETVAADLSPLTGPAAARGISPHVLISLAGNVAVFVPLGAALSLALSDRSLRTRFSWTLILGSGLSLSIELIQLAIPSRVSALDDWLLNTLGVVIGVLGIWGIYRMFKPQRAQRTQRRPEL